MRHPPWALTTVRHTDSTPSTQDYLRIMERCTANNIPTPKNQYINTQARPRHVKCTRRRTCPPLATPYSTKTPTTTHTHNARRILCRCAEEEEEKEGEEVEMRMGNWNVKMNAKMNVEMNAKMSAI